MSPTSDIAAPGPRSSTSPALSDSVFLMVNTLETGGTERQFVELARALRADGVEVHAACVRKKGALAAELNELAEFPLGGSLYGLQSLRSRWRLQRYLRRLRARVAHAFDFYANLTLIPAAKLAGVQGVIGSHRQLGDLLTPGQFRAQLTVFRMCDRVVCNSQAAAGRLLEAGLPEDRVVVIGNALSAEAFAPAAPAIARAEGVLRIGMIARMNAEYKNHRGFLRAAKSLTERFSNLEFVLAGDGPLRSQLEDLVEQLGLRERVHFLGDRRDIPGVLASVDISVVPSVSESMSNVMLESMAAGVPVVATAVGGNCELAEGGRALLVRAGNDAALSEGLARLVEDRALRVEMARRANQFVHENFTVERICRRYEEIYAEVLAEKTSSVSRPKLQVTHFSQRRREVGHPRSAGIRVALVAPSLRYVGGQAVQADLLSRNWKDDPALAASFIAVDPRLPYGLRWAERVPGLRTVLRQPLYAWRLWHALRNVDIAHIFSASYTSFLLAPLPAWAMARMRGKKTLINYRSGEARDHLQRSPIARHVLRKADRVVAPSGYLVEVFREFGLEARAIPNIVDVSQFSFHLRRPLRPYLVCTRGFHPYYSIDVVVRAFAEVQKKFCDARLDLVGGGPVEAKIRALVNGLKLSGVHFEGVASRSTIGRYYDRADIFINASHLDNMPVSILEAFAAGTPVVTTDPEGMRYVVEHERTGLVSPVGDERALAANVLRLLEDSEMAERLAMNAQRQVESYSWPIVREQWREVYRELVTEGH